MPLNIDEEKTKEMLLEADELLRRQNELYKDTQKFMEKWKIPARQNG